VLSMLAHQVNPYLFDAAVLHRPPVDQRGTVRFVPRSEVSDGCAPLYVFQRQNINP